MLYNTEEETEEGLDTSLQDSFDSVEKSFNDSEYVDSEEDTETQTYAPTQEDQLQEINDFDIYDSMNLSIASRKNPIAPDDELDFVKLEKHLEKDEIERMQFDRYQNDIKYEQYSNVSDEIRVRKLSEMSEEDRFNNVYSKSLSKYEGGYGRNKDDSGNYVDGKLIGTNHGISAKTYKIYYGKTPSVNDMKNLSQGQANEIYHEMYYKRFNIGKLPLHLQEIVYHGVLNSESHAVKVLQEAAGMTGSDVDGVMGPGTIAAISKNPPSRQMFATNLLKKYKGFKKWNVFGEGWTNRFQGLANI